MAKIPSADIRFSQTVSGLAGIIQDIVYRLEEQKILDNDTITSGSISIYKEGLNLLASTVDGRRTLIKTFIEHSYSSWGKIHDRDTKYFITDAKDVFKGLPLNIVAEFCKMFVITDSKGKSIVNDNETASLFDYFASLVKISIKYIHEQRVPTEVQNDSQTIRSYSKEFMKDIDILKHAKIWSINLEYTRA